MQFNFDEVVDRRGTRSVKWESFSPDVLPLWVADTDFSVNPIILKRIQERLNHPVLGYTLVNHELILAVQNFLYTQYQWVVDEAAIIPMTGVVPGLNFSCRAFCKPGDGVLFQVPVYPPFYDAPRNNFLEAQTSSLYFDKVSNSYKIDFDEFENSIKSNTRLFMLCNPHNPVGRVFRRDELSALADICIRHDLVICSDEIHSDIIFSGNYHIPIATLSPEISRRTVTLISPSKTFNIPGLNCSLAVIEDERMRQQFVQALKGLSNGANLLGQIASCSAYSECQDWYIQAKKYIEGNRDFLEAYCDEALPGIHMTRMEATYLAWLDCSESGILSMPQEFFLDQAKVGLNAGSTFGAGFERFVRLNIGTSRIILEEALDRMSKSLKKL